jgi:hypothetical protein
MRCQDVQSLIHHYYEGKVEEFTKIKIHHHLSGCNSCTEHYDMWIRGEEFISKRVEGMSTIESAPKRDSSSLIMESVMGRIQLEEKWANPSVKHNNSFSGRTKTRVSFVFTMFLIFFTLIFASTLIPDNEITVDRHEPVAMMDDWDFNKIVMKERAQQDETTMDFRVVASLHDPLIYMLPVESKKLPYGIIFSVFGILCIILGMSWITRV